MTDDKGAGEGLYRHSTYGHATGDLTKCLACAYDKGRKAERERCLAIIKTHNCWIHPSLKQIAREIGGQDEK
jgi:hypothetical protein